MQTINNKKFKFKKKLGQNFLVNKGIAEKIVQCINMPEKATVIEIGPGSGSLTQALIAANIAELIVVEVDHTLIPQLEKLKKKNSNLQVINADALNIAEEDLTTKKFKIIANLPYNIGTLLLIKWLKKIVLVDEIIIMLQQEVANRIIAKKSTKAYGRISVLAQSLCYCEKLFDVEPQNFYPQPKVMSSVIKLTPKKTLLTTASIEKLEKVCKVMFNYRRKKIRTNLKKNFPDIEEILTDIQISPDARAESLSVEEFHRISQKVNFN